MSNSEVNRVFEGPDTKVLGSRTDRYPNGLVKMCDVGSMRDSFARCLKNASEGNFPDTDFEKALVGELTRHPIIVLSDTGNFWDKVPQERWDGFDGSEPNFFYHPDSAVNTHAFHGDALESDPFHLHSSEKGRREGTIFSTRRNAIAHMFKNFDLLLSAGAGHAGRCELFTPEAEKLRKNLGDLMLKGEDIDAERNATMWEAVSMKLLSFNGHKCRGCREIMTNWTKSIQSRMMKNARKTDNHEIANEAFMYRFLPPGEVGFQAVVTSRAIEHALDGRRVKLKGPHEFPSPGEISRYNFGN